MSAAWSAYDTICLLLYIRSSFVFKWLEFINSILSKTSWIIWTIDVHRISDLFLIQIFPIVDLSLLLYWWFSSTSFSLNWWGFAITRSFASLIVVCIVRILSIVVIRLLNTKQKLYRKQARIYIISILHNVTFFELWYYHCGLQTLIIYCPHISLSNSLTLWFNSSSSSCFI